jgi:hypothetical protein
MMTTKKKFRVSMAYKRWPHAVLDEFAGHTVSCMTGNTAFPAPTVKLTDVATLQTAFHSAIDNAADGGKQLTAVKSQTREALLEALDKNAMYVQGIAAYDLPTLRSSGYFETSSNHAQSPLDAPIIAAVLNEQSTQLTVRLTPVTNAYAYEVQIRTGTADWKSAGVFTQARRIVLSGLTSGSIYTMQARAFGGSTGSSAWSDPVSHIAT